MESVAIVFISLSLITVVPLAIVLHYVTKWKSLRGLSADEQETLERLWHDAESMQSRIDALETILDSRAPDWRRDL